MILSYRWSEKVSGKFREVLKDELLADGPEGEENLGERSLCKGPEADAAW